MKCPRTGFALKAIKVGGVTVDISEECGGVFFDSNEVEKFNEKTKIRGGLLVHHLKQFTPPELDLSKRVYCPKCHGVMMERRGYTVNNQIEIDTCPSCGGTWFDFGELEKLRDLLSSEGYKFESMLLNSSAYQEYKDALDQKVHEDERYAKANQLHLFLFNSLY
jgi:Zn-finger nucleic acid-binding protein